MAWYRIKFKMALVMFTVHTHGAQTKLPDQFCTSLQR